MKKLFFKPITIQKLIPIELSSPTDLWSNLIGLVTILDYPSQWKGDTIEPIKHDQIAQTDQNVNTKFNGNCLGKLKTLNIYIYIYICLCSINAL